MKSRMLVAALVMTVAGAALAAPLKPEEQIKFRKAGYSFMAWNMGKIKASLDGGFNKDEVQKAAAAVATVANAGLGGLFGPGTDKDVGEQRTRVKAEFFQEQDKVKELALAFNKEANELARIAAAGDANAIKAQFGKTGEACKACHDKFRKD